MVSRKEKKEHYSLNCPYCNEEYKEIDSFWITYKCETKISLTTNILERSYCCQSETNKILKEILQECYDLGKRAEYIPLGMFVPNYLREMQYDLRQLLPKLEKILEIK